MFRCSRSSVLHYYPYFIHEELGLCYLRVPTWAPFRLPFYCNGRHHLAAKLRQAGIAHRLVDNVFTEIADFERAQKLADELDPKRLHRILDRLARLYCPVVRHFMAGTHWSLLQLEYATDLVFESRAALAPLYGQLIRTAIHALKAEDIATFSDASSTPATKEKSAMKHHMGRASIKMYDKLGLVLRLETTANDVTFFKHDRKVEHRDGTWERKVAPVKKSIYSLPDLRELMAASNRRYLDFLATVDDPAVALRDLEKISRPALDGEPTARGFNLFPGDDLDPCPG